MPVCFIEGASALTASARKKLVEEASRSIHGAYPIPDTRVFIREYGREQVGQDGALGEPVRPVCFLEVPPGSPLEGRRKLVQELTRAIDAAYGSSDTLVFFHEYPLELVGLNGGLQSENPRTVAATRQLAEAANAR